MALSAISSSDSGSNIPALAPAGRASPSSQVTASGSISHIIAARSRSDFITFSVESVTAMPEANNTRLPPVRLLYPIVAVSPISTDTR